MGVDNSASGGIGIYVDEDFISKIVLSGKASQESLDNDLGKTLDDLATGKHIKVETFGNAYCDDVLGKMIVMDAKTLSEAMEIRDDFIKEIYECFGVMIGTQDLKIIVENYTW